MRRLKLNGFRAINSLSLSLSQFTEPFSFRIHELESRLSKLSQAERAEDAKQKELIHGLKVENVDLNLKIAELEREMVSVLIENFTFEIIGRW